MSLLPIKKILAPIDFSDHSHRALKNAVELAEYFSAKLYTVHIVASVPVLDAPYAGGPGIGMGMEPTGTIGMDVVAYQEQLLKTSRESLDKTVAENVPTSVVVKKIVEVGDAASKITEIAEREGIDIIVMATHGVTGLSHILIGSVAEKVVRYSPVPVLTVRLPKEKG